ncbi:MAG: PLP-dependent aminotransferase family protein [Dehalococcoidia bacterium]
MTIQLADDPSKPAYMRLADAVREGILDGRFRPGEKMPPTRPLASALGMARNTALEAYEQLLAEGYLASRHGSGTYVAERLPDEAFRAPEEVAVPRATRMGEARVSAFARRVLTSGAVEQAAGERTAARYEFRYGTPSLDEFPMEAWRTLTKRVLDYPPAELLGYGPTQGLPRLREALARYLQRSRGVRCSAEDVLVVNGSQQALDLAARVLIDVGDRVVIEEPCYQGARIVFEANGAKLVPVPCDQEGLQCDALPEEAVAAYVTPSHQFPTGAVMSAPRRLELLQWAERTGATIIEDDYDSEFRYEGRPLAALQGLDRSGRVIYTRTFSKVLLPALRMGYVVAPPHLRDAMVGSKWLADRHVAMLYQAVLALFIEEGHFERHLRRMRKVYERRRATLLAAFAEEFGDEAVVTGTQGGMHVLVQLRGVENDGELIAQAREVGVGIYSADQYYMVEKPALATFMMGYSSVDEDGIREGVRRLRRLVG